MKKLVALALSLLSATASAYGFVPKKNLSKTTQNIELDANNTIVVRGEFNDAMASKFIKDLEDISGDEVFVHISSGGGSVLSGLKMISYARSSPKKLVCVVDVAISMAFVFLQACDERISTSNSVAMQHVTSYGIRPQQAPNAVSFQKFLERMAELMDVEQAKRIGLGYKEFKAVTRSDWWTFGQDVAAAGVTDRHANVLCTKKAVTSSYEEVLQGPFGKATVSWSKCPLITEPLSVDMSKAYGNAEMLNDFVKSLNVRQTIMDKIEG